MKNTVSDQPHETFQLQYRKCGKDNCSVCRDGVGHGPYWYAYRWERIDGKLRLRSRYVGKTLPAVALKSSEESHRKVRGRAEIKRRIIAVD